MIFLDELKNLTLYKKKLFLPINEKNKRRGSVVFLLTPNYESSKNLLNNDKIINKWFESYYIEKDITYFINQEGYIVLDDNIPYNVLNEELRSHIMIANNINEEYTSIKVKDHPLYKYIDFSEYNPDDIIEVPISDINGTNINEADIPNTLKNSKSLQIALKRRIRKPINKLKRVDPTDPSNTKDQIEKLNQLTEELQESYQIGHIVQDYSIDKICLRTKDCMILFNENLDENIMNETNKEYNPILHKLLYKERYRTPKEVISIYNKVKDDNPFITRTYLDYNRYKKLNLFVDLSFYNQTFFKNNIYKLDRGVDLYFEFISRFLSDSRLDTAGYTKKTIFIPIEDWTKPDVKKIFKYREDINPISMIYRMMENHKLQMVKDNWKDITLVLFSSIGYFKIDINELEEKDIIQIPVLLDKLKNKTTVIPDDNKESPKAIVANIVDKVETSQNIQINNLTGKLGEKSISKDALDDKLKNSITSKNDNININQDKSSEGLKQDNDINQNKPSEDVKQNDELKNELIDKLKDVAKDSSSTEDVLDDIDNDDNIKKIIDILASQEDNSVKINAARSARATKLENEFLEKKLKQTTVRQMIQNATNNEPIPKTTLELDTVNEEWKDLHYVNFEKIYNPNEDIVAMLHSFSKKTVPVMVRNIDVEDSSTTEDYKDTWNVEMEDIHGNRFTLKFDVPKYKENKFLMLGGNEKTINGQLVLLPIIKTDENTVQIVSNYKKIFIERFGTSKGKSNVVADRLIKSLNKENPFKITTGDNTKVCSKYELPIDYIDLSSQFSKIETKKHIFYFNQDEIREKYKDKLDLKIGIPIGIEKGNDKILYFDGDNKNSYSNILYTLLISDDPSYEDFFNKTSISSKYTYSKASILNTEIPLIVIMAYNEGLTKVLKKANIKYDIVEKRPSYNKNLQDIIRFKDAYILYDLDYNSSLLMNGLKECGTEMYSISEINNKNMYLEFLDLFGGRLRADGLDNFYDLMIDDPITTDILKFYKLPTDYIEILAYANALLGDNKYIKHTDQRGRRYRSNEIIAGYTYQALADSYGDYRTKLKRSPKATMMIKQNEVINRVLLDPTASDLSTLNPLLELESINTVSTKGLVGMNSDKGYSLDKRTFDKSMVNVLGLSTGFAGNVGIARQATIDMNIEGKRGYIKVTDDVSDLNITKSLTITEALTPFGTNMDDPFRSAMTFIQTSKHGMRVEKGSPLLITNGADEALPYLVTDKFAFKAKEDGKVIEKTDLYMIIQYKSGKKDYIDLRDNVKKNSDGGFFLTLKLDSDYKVGNSFKANDIIAYDKLSFSNKIGHTDNIAYNLGTLVKIAVLNTDEGYEDSAIISEYLSNAMASDVVLMKDISLPKDTNVYNIVKKGEPIQEGDPLIIFQNAFDEDDANLLLKNLAGDEEDISDLGRIRVKSKITGIVQDIKVYRTVEKDELSDSLKKLANNIEKETKQLKTIMKKYDINEYNKLDPDYKLDPTGKLKNINEGVLIEFYLKYKDKMSVGDKLIYYSALKGVVKDIFPINKEPYTDFRPTEKIHSLLSNGSVTARMVGSILLSMIINKVLIELDRKIKTELGIPFKFLDEI